MPNLSTFRSSPPPLLPATALSPRTQPLSLSPYPLWGPKPLPLQKVSPTPKFPPSLNNPSDYAYMSSGDILLTNERIEKSIPYISLYSWRERGRVSSRFLKEPGLGWEGARVWREEAGLGQCAFGDVRSPGLRGALSSPPPWGSPLASCGATRCNADTLHSGQTGTGCGQSWGHAPSACHSIVPI